MSIINETSSVNLLLSTILKLSIVKSEHYCTWVWGTLVTGEDEEWECKGGPPAMMQVAVMVVAADAAVSLSICTPLSLLPPRSVFEQRAGWWPGRFRAAAVFRQRCASYSRTASCPQRDLGAVPYLNSTTRSAPEAVQEVKHDRHATSTVSVSVLTQVLGLKVVYCCLV